jgi:hypothetical protein
MKPLKIIQDQLSKLISGPKMVPQGLAELQRYFRIHDPIHFIYHQEDGSIVAISENFRYGSIVTSAKNMEQLDQNIKDAILTAFEIPSVYAKQAGIKRTDQLTTEYAPA